MVVMIHEEGLIKYSVHVDIFYLVFITSCHLLRFLLYMITKYIQWTLHAN